MEEKTLNERKSQKDVYEEMRKAEEERRLSAKMKRKGRSFLQTIMYYGMPLISLGIFFGVSIWGTIPSIKGIFNYMDEIEIKEEELDDLESDLEVLTDLKAEEASMRRDLDIIEKIVPSEKTQVAKFVGEIVDLAEENDVEEYEYASGENRENVDEEDEIEEEIESQQLDTASIIRIPSESEYVATFENIEDFLNALYFKDDFIIVGLLDMQGEGARRFIASQQRQQGTEVTVDQSLSSKDWKMEVTFEKYQFSKGFSEYIKNNLVSLRSEPNQEILQYIRERYGE